jgi:transketolase
MPSRREFANAIRFLSMDAVQKANSGHPGAPMGMADIAEVLWRDVLKYNPAQSNLVDRDRFVLSNGHASMLLYSVLHLTGYPLSMDESSASANSARKPGAPGARNASRHRDHHGAAGSGYFQRGRHGARRAQPRGDVQSARISDRRSSHLRVRGRRLPDGRHLARSRHRSRACRSSASSSWSTTTTAFRSTARSWAGSPTTRPEALRGLRLARRPARRRPRQRCGRGRAGEARAVTDRPSLICAKTIIGWGAPNKQGTAAMHGEARATKRSPRRERLSVGRRRRSRFPPTSARPGTARTGARAEQQWRTQWNAYKAEFPHSRPSSSGAWTRDLPAGFDELAERLCRQDADRRRRARDPPVLASGAECVRPEFAGAARRLGGSHAVERHLRKDSVVLTPDAPAGNYCISACANSACRRS